MRNDPRRWGWIVLLAMATLALSIVAAGDSTLRGDVAIGRWVQRTPSGVGQPAADTVGTLGSTPSTAAFALIAAIGFILARHREAATIVIAAALLRVFTPVLKWLFDSPRPTPDVLRVSETPASTGFPSGHIIGVTLLGGAIAAVLLRQGRFRRRGWLGVGIASVLVLLTGFGRVYSGAHWPSDVLGGIFWASLLLIGLFRAVEWLGPHRRRLNKRLNPIEQAGRWRRRLPSD